MTPDAVVQATHGSLSGTTSLSYTSYSGGRINPGLLEFLRYTKRSLTVEEATFRGPETSVTRYRSDTDESGIDPIAIIEHGQRELRKDVEDIDPAIRKLIKDNFDDLLWR